MSDTNYAAKLEEIDASFRQIGLYLSAHQVVVPGQDPDEVAVEYGSLGDEDRPKHAVFMVRFDLGDIAFSKRVLDPEQIDFDAAFRLMAAETEQSMTDETKRGLQERIDRGEDPYAS